MGLGTEAARRSAESSERLVQLESLPIVWGRIGSISSAPTRGSLLEVIARNVGRAVALKVSFGLLIDGELHWPVSMGSALDPIVGEAKGRLTLSSIEFLMEDSDPDFTIICDYEDAASQRYQTRAMRDDAHIVAISADGSERRLLAN
jgi:hypothetical protein